MQEQRNEQGYILREPGTTGDANTIRISEPDARNPNGSLKYYNAEGQPLNPETGQSGTRGETHVQPGYQGEYKNLPSWWLGK